MVILLALLFSKVYLFQSILLVYINISLFFSEKGPFNPVTLKPV
jgi:hypothetical protein